MSAGMPTDRKRTRLNSSHTDISRMPSFFFNDPATTEIYTLSLHDALPISPLFFPAFAAGVDISVIAATKYVGGHADRSEENTSELQSHRYISYAVFFF